MLNFAKTYEKFKIQICNVNTETNIEQQEHIDNTVLNNQMSPGDLIPAQLVKHPGKDYTIRDFEKFKKLFIDTTGSSLYLKHEIQYQFDRYRELGDYEYMLWIHHLVQNLIPKQIKNNVYFGPDDAIESMLNTLPLNTGLIMAVPEEKGFLRIYVRVENDNPTEHELYMKKVANIEIEKYKIISNVVYGDFIHQTRYNDFSHFVKTDHKYYFKTMFNHHKFISNNVKYIALKSKCIDLINKNVKFRFSAHNKNIILKKTDKEANYKFGLLGPIIQT